MTAAQGFLATDAVLEGQESRNSLKNSLFAGNLPGDWSGQDCVASQAVGLSWGHFAEYEKSPPLAGFHALEAGLHLPIWRLWSAKSPRVSARLRRYSHFRETAAGDLVRSRLPGEAGSAILL